MSDNSKTSIRKDKRALRQALSDEHQAVASQGLLRNLLGLEIFKADRHIAFYLAYDGEIDPAPALNHARQQGVHCYLPIIPAKGEREMHFGRITDATAFTPNRFNIPEPVVSGDDFVRASRLDWVMVPLVAFDKSGNRIGMGGGFYDTTLNTEVAPSVLGLAHELQRVECIPSDAWDIPIQRIVTDVTVYQCLRGIDV